MTYDVSMDCMKTYLSPVANATRYAHTVAEVNGWLRFVANGPRTSTAIRPMSYIRIKFSRKNKINFFSNKLLPS